MNKKKIAVIGGGIAGMEAANCLVSLGFDVAVIEKKDRLGGHVSDWHHLFPNHEPAQNITEVLERDIHDKVELYYNTTIKKSSWLNGIYKLELLDGRNIACDAIVVATGYSVFDALKKEEYGYKIYDNVITSADLELKFKTGKPIKTQKGKIPQKIAIIHCVGSRDEKAGNTYCSKVCCITGVNQAIELKQMFPNGRDIFFLYGFTHVRQIFRRFVLRGAIKWN